MSLIIDKKYISLVSTRLERFAQKNDYLWNFRCPVCGDSKKNKLKARAYFYRKKSNLSFMCHNCHSSMSFGNFLKTIDKSLYREYQLERYKEENHSNVKQPDFSLAKEKPVFNTIKIPSIKDLPDNHIAKKYVLDRQIPMTHWNDIYYAEDFKTFINDTIPHNKIKLIDNDRRLVLPFYTEKNILAGVQGRSLTNSKVRYITLKVSEDSKKIYGLNRIDFTKPIYVVEGPIDSLFLENSIATMDSALYSVLKTVGDYDYVFVPDIQPRNTNIVESIKKCIKTGKKVTLLPDTLKGKDINEIILSNNMSQQTLMNLVTKYTYQGLRAELEFNLWKKI